MRDFFMDTTITTIEQPSSDHIGNTLEKGIRGEYDFAVGRILSEAWEKIYGFKGPFWKGFLWVVLLLIVLGIASVILGGIIGLFSAFAVVSQETIKLAASVLNWIIQIIYSLFIAPPIAVGLLMLSVKKLIDLPARGRTAISYFHYWNKLWWAYFILLALGGVVTLLSILLLGVFPNAEWLGGLVMVVGAVIYIYLSVAYLFFPLLVVEKKLTGWQALEASRKAIGHHWFKVAWLLVVMLLICIGSVFTLGILFIWTLPMMNNALAILYREMFGIDKASAGEIV